MKRKSTKSNIILLSIISVVYLTLCILWGVDLIMNENTNLTVRYCYISISFISFLNILLGIQGIILQKTSLLIAYTTM